MDNLKVGESLNLDKKEYIVVSTTKKNNKEYAYLVTQEEPYQVKFAEEIINNNGLDLKIINESKEKQELLELFKQELLNKNK